MRCLDVNFREALNLRLSLQGHLRVDALRRSRVKDPYALDQVIQKAVVTPYKRLGKISDILYLNNKNNQLERRVRPPKDVPLDAQSWT